MYSDAIFIDINKWIIDINSSAANVLNGNTGCNNVTVSHTQQLLMI